ncbi:MAG: catalase [Eubacterium sp.]|nr:catalase [Eubacterium sp.]
MDFLGHLKTIDHHKYLVTKMCFQVGLYKQGILHDLSKYHPVEFIPGVIYYQGDRSPIAREKEVKGLSRGWLHHKGRNPHHFEYWIDYTVVKKGAVLTGMKMSRKYVAEMVIDRICASKNYQKENYTDRSALEYYMKTRPAMIIHKESDFLARYLMTMLAVKGEKYFIRYMKHVLLKNKEGDYHVVDGHLILD